MSNHESNHIIRVLQNAFVRIFFLLCLLLVTDYSSAQNNNQSKVTQIRQQMAKIRQTTNWDNPEEAKKANEKIKELMKQLMAATSPSSANQGGGTNNGQGSQDETNSDGSKMNELQMEMMKQKADVYTQIWEAGSSGKSAPVLLAKPLREEIVQEFKEDDNSKVNNADWLESMPYLLINVSMPGVQAVIDQMPEFKGIKILVITCDKRGTIVDLNSILYKAKDYPLEELYIINFGTTVSTLPTSIGNFSSLKKLSLLNNSIKKLPASISKLTQLETLHADVNPIQSLFQEIALLKSLKHLGIAKTQVTEDEIKKIRQALPNCEILK